MDQPIEGEKSFIQNYVDQFQSHLHYYHRYIQKYLDIITPFTVYRWLSTTFLLLLFCARIVLSQGFDPSIEEDEMMDNVEEGGGDDDKSNTYGGGGGYGLGAGGIHDQDEEFRPFIRRLPEFKFWYSATRSITISLLCTTTSALDIPVYWPILLVYFFILFSLTMRRQIEHMIKYRYIPFDLGRKVRYGSK